MTTENKTLFKKTIILGLGIYIIIFYLVYAVFKNYAIDENEAKLQDLLMHNKALHTYVEQTLKPVIYELKKQGKIEQDYFDPKILSFTYMSRNIMDEYNKQRASNNIEKIRYKLASDNPRNTINKANTQEKNILKKFNNKEFKKYHNHFNKDGKDYVQYAMPVTENAQSCMKCHGIPKDAPQSLIDLYGDKAGFYEKLGDIRALISVTLPLEVELGKMQKFYKVLLIVGFLLFIVVYIIIYYFIRELDKKDVKLLEQANVDALTKTFNRHVFNKDIVSLLKHGNNQNKFLMILDIDHFKNVNDTYGHPVGDSVLIELSEIILKTTRSTDTLYRIGGEEFAILSFQKAMEDEIEFAARLRKEVNSKVFKDVGKITVSAGITQVNKDDNFEILFNRADKALYEAKAAGRDTIKVI